MKVKIAIEILSFIRILAINFKHLKKRVKKIDKNIFFENDFQIFLTLIFLHAFTDFNGNFLKVFLIAK